MSKKYWYGALVGFILLLVFIAITFYPQFFYCKDSYQFNRYTVYFCGGNHEISSQDKNRLKIVLSKTNSLLKKSVIFDPNQSLSFKIFLRTTSKEPFNLPYQFNTEAYAQTIPLFHNIFVWKPNLKTDEVFIPSGHHRPLSAILAHEIVHVLYERHYGWHKVITNWLDKQECSSIGFMWKDEGYAEYIAGGSGIRMEDGLSILNGHPNSMYHPIEVEYFKYWLTVKYLIDVKHLTFDEIVHTKMHFDTVSHNAVDHFNAQPLS